jgi:hypothetical protein
VGGLLVGGYIVQVTEEFFLWPRKTMVKKRSPERSPLRFTSKAPKNVYEDSGTDKSEDEILRGRDSRGLRYENDSAWRTAGKRREEYESDGSAYRSPRYDRRQETRSPHGGVHDNYYAGRGRRERPHEGPSTRKLRQKRS